MRELSSHRDDSGEARPAAHAGMADRAADLTSRLRAFRARHVERSCLINGQVWHYLLGGQGERTALLLHGSASDGESLFELMAPLERSYRVIAPTYPDGIGTIATVVDGLAGLLDALSMPPALVVGYSLGGYLAQAMAWRYPERVAGLALLNTGGPAPGAARASAIQNVLLAAAPGRVVRAAARLGAAALLTLEAPGLERGEVSFWRGYFAEMARRVGKSRMLTHGRLVVNFLSGPAGVTLVMERSPAPAILIVNSARDRSIEPEERRALDRLYPHAAWVMEPNAGHLSVLTQSERYLAAIEATFSHPRASE